MGSPQHSVLLYNAMNEIAVVTKSIPSSDPTKIQIKISVLDALGSSSGGGGGEMDRREVVLQLRRLCKEEERLRANSFRREEMEREDVIMVILILLLLFGESGNELVRSNVRPRWGGEDMDGLRGKEEGLARKLLLLVARPGEG